MKSNPLKLQTTMQQSTRLKISEDRERIDEGPLLYNYKRVKSHKRLQKMNALCAVRVTTSKHHSFNRLYDLEKTFLRDQFPWDKSRYSK